MTLEKIPHYSKKKKSVSLSTQTRPDGTPLPGTRRRAPRDQNVPVSLVSHQVSCHRPPSGKLPQRRAGASVTSLSTVPLDRTLSHFKLALTSLSPDPRLTPRSLHVWLWRCLVPSETSSAPVSALGQPPLGILSGLHSLFNSLLVIEQPAYLTVMRWSIDVWSES